MRPQALQSHQQEWVQSGAPIAEIMSREEATPVEARRRFVFPPKSKLSHKGPAPGLLLDSELSEEEGSGSDEGAEFGDAVGKAVGAAVTRVHVCPVWSSEQPALQKCVFLQPPFQPPVSAL